jgi:uncharacterized protein with HEPN domain
MSRPDPKITLRQLLEHSRRVQELVATVALKDMLKDWKLASAFEREMEVLGEATKRLPADLTARYPQIPWKQIAGMRDRISHGYDETDYDVLWQAARDDVPPLAATVEQMLRDLTGA